MGCLGHEPGWSARADRESRTWHQQRPRRIKSGGAKTPFGLLMGMKRHTPQGAAGQAPAGLRYSKQTAGPAAI